LVWAVVPLRHCTGARSHQHQETKYPPVVWDYSARTEIKEIAIAIFSC